MTMMRERSFRSVWLSDLHLGNADCRALWLLDFLDACTCEQLYLVGDVLDLWEMDRRGRWPATHGRVLAKLIALAAAGTRVVWLPGNHDEACGRITACASAASSCCRRRSTRPPTAESYGSCTATASTMPRAAAG